MELLFKTETHDMLLQFGFTIHKVYSGSSISPFNNIETGVENHLSGCPGQVEFQAGQADIFTQCPADK